MAEIFQHAINYQASKTGLPGGNQVSLLSSTIFLSNEVGHLYERIAENERPFRMLIRLHL
jgi:hypothetical protein